MEFQCWGLGVLKTPTVSPKISRQPYVWELAACFYGPFPVVERIGSVACKLDLPSSTKIHPVTHVLHLKRAVWSRPVSQAISPHTKLWLDLGSRARSITGSKTILVQWLGLPEWEATWKDFQKVNCLFPDFHLEDKVKFWARVNARNLTCPTVVLTYQIRRIKTKE